MEVLPPFAVKSLKNLKDMNEVMLARELYDIFEQSETLKKPLREIAYVAVKYIEGLYSFLKSDVQYDPYLKKLVIVLKKESGLKMWGQTQPSTGEMAALGLTALANRWQSYTTNDCSEMLRLFGGVIEEVDFDGYTPEIINPRRDDLHASMPPRSLLDELRKAYRSGYGENVSKTNWDKGQIVGKGKEFSAPFRGDVRKRDQARLSNDGLTVSFKAANAPMENETLRPLTQDQAAYVMGSSIRTDEREVRGMTLWKLKDGSVTWAIDRIFGLPPGADISGTTADLMWAMEIIATIIYPSNTKSEGANKVGHRFGVVGFKRELELLYLLPIAAMVAHYHHTILECALTQTFNSVIKYAVGFYTTLLPSETDSPIAEEIRQVLEKWENHPLNFKMILFTEENEEWAVIFTTPKEISAFKEFATMDYDHYAEVFAPLKDKDKIGLSDIQSVLTSLPLTVRKAFDIVRQEKEYLASLVGKKS